MKIFRKKETLEDFMKRHGYRNGKPETIEEVIYWTSVFTYEKKLNWRRQLLRIRKSLNACKNIKE